MSLFFFFLCRMAEQLKRSKLWNFFYIDDLAQSYMDLDVHSPKKGF